MGDFGNANFRLPEQDAIETPNWSPSRHRVVAEGDAVSSHVTFVSAQEPRAPPSSIQASINIDSRAYSYMQMLKYSHQSCGVDFAGGFRCRFLMQKKFDPDRSGKVIAIVVTVGSAVKSGYGAAIEDTSDEKHT